MKEFEIYRELGQLELVAVIRANDYDEAREKAKRLGFGKEYRIEEVD